VSDFLAAEQSIQQVILTCFGGEVRDAYDVALREVRGG
jgi:hypothetical protein